MFNQIVASNNLLDDIANSYFGEKIIARSHPEFRGQYDLSWLATCRALLCDKMKDDDFLIVDYRNYNARVDRTGIENIVTNLKSVRNAFLNRSEYAVLFATVMLNNSYNSFDRAIEYMNESESFREIEKARLFFVKNFKCGLYVNESEGLAIFLMESHKSTDVNIRYYHAAQCIILNALPWYFDAEKDKEKLTKSDLGLINAIATGDYEEYTRLINQKAEEYDFRKEAIRNLINAFELQVDNNKVSFLETRIRSCAETIESLMRDIASYTRQKRENMATLEGIRMGILQKEGKHELLNMFEAYDNLRFVKMYDDNLIFAVDKYIDDWNEDAKDLAIDNRGSLLYRYVSQEYHDDVFRLFNAVFNEHSVKIPVTGLYTINPEGLLRGRDGCIEDIKENNMPSPHIYYYRCTGGFDEDIAEALNHQNFAFAVEIAMQSAGNINFEDSAVMERWIRWMFLEKCGGRKCFELSDGSRVNIDEALNWIKEQEGENDEQIN